MIAVATFPQLQQHIVAELWKNLRGKIGLQHNRMNLRLQPQPKSDLTSLTPTKDKAHAVLKISGGLVVRDD